MVFQLIFNFGLYSAAASKSQQKSAMLFMLTRLKMTENYGKREAKAFRVCNLFLS